MAKFLGHAKPTVTMSVYAHWFNTRKTAGTMAAVAGAIFGERGSSLVAVGNVVDTGAGASMLKTSAPDAIRTRDPRIRNPVLYPPELRGRAV